MITVATASSRSRLTCRAAASEPSGSSAGPSAIHHACVHTNDVAGGGRDRRDVLGGVPRSPQQPDRRTELEPLGVPVEPAVPHVGRPVIVDPGRREQRGIDRVVGVVMAEHHVGDVPGLRAVLGQRGEQRSTVGDHARVDDDHRVAVQDQGHRPAHPLVVAIQADVPVMQHEYRGGPARCDIQISHRADLIHPAPQPPPRAPHPIGSRWHTGYEDVPRGTPSAPGAGRLRR